MVDTYPAEVLRYAVKHVYNDLVDEAALVCLELPMDKVLDVLDAEDAGIWVRRTEYIYI
jgi:hypothetical protein